LSIGRITPFTPFTRTLQFPKLKTLALCYSFSLNFFPLKKSCNLSIGRPFYTIYTIYKDKWCKWCNGSFTKCFCHWHFQWVYESEYKMNEGNYYAIFLVYKRYSEIEQSTNWFPENYSSIINIPFSRFYDYFYSVFFFIFHKLVVAM